MACRVVLRSIASPESQAALVSSVSAGIVGFAAEHAAGSRVRQQQTRLRQQQAAQFSRKRPVQMALGSSGEIVAEAATPHPAATSAGIWDRGASSQVQLLQQQQQQQQHQQQQKQQEQHQQQKQQQQQQQEQQQQEQQQQRRRQQQQQQQQHRRHQELKQHRQQPPSGKEPAEEQCHFWLARKSRWCANKPKPGHCYCGNHLPEAQLLRIPCPLDPSHTVAAADLASHLNCCPAAKQKAALLSQPYVRMGVNTTTIAAATTSATVAPSLAADFRPNGGTHQSQTASSNDNCSDTVPLPLSIADTDRDTETVSGAEAAVSSQVEQQQRQQQKQQLLQQRRRAAMLAMGREQWENVVARVEAAVPAALSAASDRQGGGRCVGHGRSGGCGSGGDGNRSGGDAEVVCDGADVGGEGKAGVRGGCGLGLLRKSVLWPAACEAWAERARADRTAKYEEKHVQQQGSILGNMDCAGLLPPLSPASLQAADHPPQDVARDQDQPELQGQYRGENAEEEEQQQQQQEEEGEKGRWSEAKQVPVYVELGAGRGYLTQLLCDCYGVRDVVLVERRSYKLKADRALRKMVGMRLQRIRADIGDLDLARVEVLEGREFVAIGKHLCGAATDLALRCCCSLSPATVATATEARQNVVPAAMQESGDITADKRLPVCRGIAIATCCHHLCTWDTYSNPLFFQSLGFNKDDFDAIAWMSSWALLLQQHSEATQADSASNEAPSNGERTAGGGDRVGHQAAWADETVAAKARIGRLCKTLIDLGRVEWLKGVSASTAASIEIVDYIDAAVSPENRLILLSVRSQ